MMRLAALLMLVSLMAAAAFATATKAQTGRTQFGLNCGTGVTALLAPTVLKNAAGRVISPTEYKFKFVCALHDKCWTKEWHVTQGLCDHAFLANMFAECKHQAKATQADCKYVAVAYHNAVAGSRGKASYDQAQLRLADAALSGDYYGHGTLTITGGSGGPVNVPWELPDGTVASLFATNVVISVAGTATMTVEQDCGGKDGCVVTWKCSWGGGAWATAVGTISGAGIDDAGNAVTYSGQVNGTTKLHG